MEAKTLKLTVGFTGNEFIDNPTHVNLEVDEDLLKSIKKAKEFVGNGIEFPIVEVNCDAEAISENGDDVSDFGRYGGIHVSNSSIFYKDFSKHDSSATIETEDFSKEIDELLLEANI